MKLLVAALVSYVITSNSVFKSAYVCSLLSEQIFPFRLVDSTASHFLFLQ